MRAPNKPLVLLFALARLIGTAASRIAFSETEHAVGPLIGRYSARGVANVVDPFLRLVSDQIWAVEDASGKPWTVSALAAVSLGLMRSADPRAGFDPRSLAALHADPLLADQAARLLLESNFPPSIQEDIVASLGLTLGARVRRPGIAEHAPSRPGRNPLFREIVLDAYFGRCAACGFSLSLGDSSPVALDAAHIRWHAYEGPDEVSNGLALCALHHRMFDTGVITVDQTFAIQVTGRLRGESARSIVADLNKRRLEAPRDDAQRPASEFLAWHHRQVFKGEMSV